MRRTNSAGVGIMLTLALGSYAALSEPNMEVGSLHRR